ncbi:MAG: hypothetical protein HZC43_00390 [Nitrosomonadales bacterium]|nr:hypothetical protein [Nitrosomonadales bacterium]
MRDLENMLRDAKNQPVLEADKIKLAGMDDFDCATLLKGKSKKVSLIARQCRLANEADKRDSLDDFGDWT